MDWKQPSKLFWWMKLFVLLLQWINKQQSINSTNWKQDFLCTLRGVVGRGGGKGKKKGSVSLLTQMENLVYGHFVQKSNHSKPDWSTL